MRGYLIITYVLFTTLFSFAQKFREDLIMLSKSYEVNKHIYMDITYKVYKSKNSNTLMDVSYGYYHRNGNNYRNKMASIESVVTTDFTIYIDSIEKQMICAKTLPQQNLLPIDLKQLDSMFHRYKKVELFKSSKDLVAYRIWPVNNSIDDVEYYELEIDKKNFILKGITLTYNKEFDFSNSEVPDLSKPRVEIYFSNIKFNPKNDSFYFLKDYYLIKRGSKYFPSENYKIYKLNII